MERYIASCRRLTLRSATGFSQRENRYRFYRRIFSRNFLADIPVARLKATQKLLML